jgi:hypothetical protein
LLSTRREKAAAPHPNEEADMKASICKLWLTAAFLVVLCGAPVVAQGVEGHIAITNLKYGLVCGPDYNRRICFQTSDIQITGEGRCVYNQQEIPCTWFGYSFDYKLPKDTVELDCEWSSTLPANLGNPIAELKENVSSYHYKIVLNRGESHFFNPQYSSVRADLGIVEVNKQQCSYNGEKLFEFTFRLHFPEL